MRQRWHHVSRPLFVLSLESLADDPPADTSNGVWMFWLESQAQLSKFSKVLNVYSRARPLLVMVAGKQKDEAFERLLNTLGALPKEPHVMTMVGNEDLANTIEELLYAGWPAEERFDEWKQYVLVVPRELLSETESAISALCNKE